MPTGIITDKKYIDENTDAMRAGFKIGAIDRSGIYIGSAKTLKELSEMLYDSREN